jgi:hypothetical protein
MRTIREELKQILESADKHTLRIPPNLLEWMKDITTETQKQAEGNDQQLQEAVNH